MRDWNFGPGAGLWSRLRDVPALDTNPLTKIVMHAFHSLGLLSGSLAVDRDTLARYFLKAEATYLPPDKVPYHNAVHASDVVQCVFSMTRQDPSLDGFPELGLFALVFGAAVHDLAHPGLNNAHLVNTAHPLALVYNDSSPLENFHISTAFKLMTDDPNVDVLRAMRASAPAEAKQFRALVVEMVLATDLKNHFDQRARFRALLARHEGPLDFHDAEETSLVCQTLLNAADISNVARTWDAYAPWIDKLFQEFYAQGRREKSMGMDVAPFMDPAKSAPFGPQTFFIQNLVMPLYETLSPFIPVTSGVAIANMQTNLIRLAELKAEAEAAAEALAASSASVVSGVAAAAATASPLGDIAEAGESEEE